MSAALSTCPFLQICLQPLCSFGLVVALCCGGSEEDGDRLVIFVLVDLQNLEVAVVKGVYIDL